MLNSADNAPDTSRFFTTALADTDPELAGAIEKELGRQQNEIELIASENIVSRAVLEAAGLGAHQQICRGLSRPALLRRLPVRRHRRAARHRPRDRELFGCGFANVQANSGSQANQAVLLGLAKPGDTLLGMSLDAGGHLTHGARPNLSLASGSTPSSTASPRTPI